jgi:hypothetical protein
MCMVDPSTRDADEAAAALDAAGRLESRSGGPTSFTIGQPHPPSTLKRRARHGRQMTESKRGRLTRADVTLFTLPEMCDTTTQ